MDEHDRIDVAEIMNGAVTLCGLIIDELDRRGALPKAEMRNLLLRRATEAEGEVPPAAGHRYRLDLEMMRQLAEGLDSERPPWRPSVIPGGKEP